MQPGGLLRQPAQAAGVDDVDVDDDQRAAIVKIEQAELSLPFNLGVRALP
jgi:hypothetical protein